jgi:copper chaperone CopZ
MIKNKFKITGMHCTSCAFNIDGELEDTEGIDEANTNFAKAETEVKFDPEKVSVEKIIKLIKTVGYTASLV